MENLTSHFFLFAFSVPPNCFILVLKLASSVSTLDATSSLLILLFQLKKHCGLTELSIRASPTGGRDGPVTHKRRRRIKSATPAFERFRVQVLKNNVLRRFSQESKNLLRRMEDSEEGVPRKVCWEEEESAVLFLHLLAKQKHYKTCCLKTLTENPPKKTNGFEFLDGHFFTFHFSFFVSFIFHLLDVFSCLKMFLHCLYVLRFPFSHVCKF